MFAVLILFFDDCIHEGVSLDKRRLILPDGFARVFAPDAGRESRFGNAAGGVKIPKAVLRELGRVPKLVVTVCLCGGLAEIGFVVCFCFGGWVCFRFGI
jgi:hypothetical protein